MVEKIKRLLQKIACRDCLFFNKKHRCDVRKTIKILRSGKRRRCASFKRKYVDPRKKPKVILRTSLEKETVPVVIKKEIVKKNLWQKFLEFLRRLFRWKKNQSSS